MPSRSLRVLVVDDERFYRERIRDLLSRSGFACEVVASGEEALKAAEHPSVGVVLLDLQLPGISGVEVGTELLRRRPSQRVVALAESTDQESVLDLLRAGACDYLAKPIHPEELSLAVQRARSAYEVASGFESLRGRLHRLGTQLDSLRARAREGLPLEGLVAEVLAEVLGATRASLMLADAEGRVLRVAGAVGAERPSPELDPAVVGESVSGLALEEGRALLIEDVARDERTRAWVRRSGYRSSCVVLAPILGDQGPIGVLCATDRVGALPFDDEDVSLLRVLALQLSGLLAPVLPVVGADAPSEADLCAELAQEICDAATNEIEPNQVLAGTLRPIQRLLAARVAAIHLIDGRTGELVMESGRDAGETGDRTRLPRDQGLTGVTLQTGQLIATTDPASDPRFDPEVDTPEDGRVGPVILAPLKLRGRVLGVARIFTDAGAGAPVRVGEILSSGLSAAVRNALLYRSLLESIDDLAEARREGADIKRP